MKLILHILFTTLFLSILMPNGLFAQVVAPKLRCATTKFNGDVELTWQLPPAACGTINGYYIWAREGANPFTLLATITNPTQTSFMQISANGNNSQWFYYLTTDANCIGQAVQSSDTLDNRPPVAPVIDNVSVVGGRVVLTWQPGADPETHSYIVYNANTNIALDTIFGKNNTQFIDPLASPTAINSYTLVTMDTCFNAGVVNTFPQQNMVLNTLIDRCTQTANLSWNAYQNWKNGVLHYEIWAGVAGATPVPIDTVSATTLQYAVKNLVDGVNTCFFVRAKAASSGYLATSNSTCATINIVQPAAYIYLKNVTVNPDSTVGIDWQWNTNTDLDSYGINSSEDNQTFQRFSVLSAQLPLVSSNHTDVVFQAIEKQKLYYKIETIDSCQKTVFSNYAATIFAQASPLENFTNKITWTAYDNPYGKASYYEVFKTLINGNSQRVATVNANNLSVEHKLTPTIEEDQNACYYVVAYANIRLPTGTPFNVTSRSNTVCAHQTVAILLPNAFAPEGNNNVFKPLAVFTNSATYQLRIFDRWGGTVFQTSDITQGWDGSTNGRPLPQGVYTYHIRVQEPNQPVIDKRGSVMLLR